MMVGGIFGIFPRCPFISAERRRGSGWRSKGPASAFAALPFAEFFSQDREADMTLPSLLNDYLPILVFLGIALFVGIAAVGLPFLLAEQRPDAEKLSPYECGFEPFDDARRKFDVRFYLVAILFIIFDLEVAFLFPWAVTLGEIGMLGFWSMVAFLGVLTVGFIYEWKKGALEWE
jgi:NADH-quinone oxidoreductase subunit A